MHFICEISFFSTYLRHSYSIKGIVLNVNWPLLQNVLPFLVGVYYTLKLTLLFNTVLALITHGHLFEISNILLD